MSSPASSSSGTRRDSRGPVLQRLDRSAVPLAKALGSSWARGHACVCRTIDSRSLFFGPRLRERRLKALGAGNGSGADSTMQVDWGVQGFDMARGQALAPAGEKGSGKSTLIKVIAGSKPTTLARSWSTQSIGARSRPSNASRLACRSSTRLRAIGLRGAGALRAKHPKADCELSGECPFRRGRPDDQPVRLSPAFPPSDGSTSLSHRLKPAPQRGGGYQNPGSLGEPTDCGRLRARTVPFNRGTNRPP